DIIIFCGVDFMAESAKILNPEKIVVHPDREAKCPMAQMVDVESLQILKNEHKDAAVVSYVNTTADVKAITDVCCTSSNAVKIIRSLPEKKIIFVPDTNLGLYVQRFIKDKKFILWPGCCPTHHKISKDEILELKKQHQNAQIIVHPECVPEVIDIADFVYSTEGMVKHVKESSSNEFIIGTEQELCYRLKKENPDKTFYSLKTAVCPTMKIITMDKVLKSLEVLKPEVILSKEIIEKAKAPLEKMMRIGRGD
ncbi:MAG: quinolinate synthase NadA, partial [Thermoplasmatales archaeon]|nr:quinolinate synthase NadA [Candidatus Thermoplasmatota archaeon]MCG2826428.1 quinolinate synthase NadA [Thermoplasmatales archaeon]